MSTNKKKVSPAFHVPLSNRTRNIAKIIFIIIIVTLFIYFYSDVELTDFLKDITPY